jgi:predicted Zn-dependent protease
MTERAERETRRRAESAFAEMERSMEDGADKFEQAEADLSALARSSYRRVVNERLLRYEKEADRLAAALLGEAGYRPRGIVQAVEHITALRTHEPDLFDEDYLTVQNLEARLQHVSTFVDRHGGEEGARLRDRFRRYADPLAR